MAQEVKRVTVRVESEAEEARTLTVKRGTSLGDLKKRMRLGENPLVPVVGVLYNHRIIGLEYRLNRDCTVKFITTDTEEGASIYRKGLSMLLHAAFCDLFGSNGTLKIEHSLNKGYFYSYIDHSPMTQDHTSSIEKQMRELVALDLPFEKQVLEKEEALDIFADIGGWDRYYLLKYSDRTRTIIYRLGKCINLAQGPVVPSTGYLRLFTLVHYPPGMILAFPTTERPAELPVSVNQKKLFQIYSEQREWSTILDVDSAGKLNRLIVKGKIDDLIWVSEALHEKKIAQIADVIAKNIRKKRIIMLAGPSSSGKTTFAKRLTIQLLVNGINPEVISLDNYYRDRERMPRDEKGNINMESLYALDVERIHEHLKLLLQGSQIDVPGYDFKTGLSTKSVRKVKLEKNQVVIFEGIHAMNENLTSSISRDEKLKIYVSALTQLNIDYINRIPTSMVRLIRRIVRDFRYRAYSARQTILHWPLVRSGEEQNIFPFQEEADIMFNSALVYEMSVLKGYVEPLLKEIEDTDPIYTKARRALHFTSNFVYINPERVPLTSILREFIGGSGFQY
jgi:uridine kinase